jgi:hypothetical protein
VPDSNRQSRRPGAVSAVKCFVRPFANWHDRYQAYYREGLRRACARAEIPFEVESVSRLPRPLGALRRFQDAGYLLKVPAAGQRLEQAVEAVGRALEGSVQLPSPIFDPGTGQYLVSAGREDPWRVCIDAMDSGELNSPELAALSDIHYKTNWWPSLTYPPNVRPLVNGDPTILGSIPALRAMRPAPKEYDLCFAVRVWGGRDAVAGIEHNLRLLEAVKRAGCRAFLLAVLVVGDVSAYERRLRKAGIATTVKSIKAADLWQVTAASRLNLLRLGVHDCIPWRVAGSLAVGSCVVLDQQPRAQWHEPLRSGVNFFDLGLVPGEDGVAPDEAYAAVPEKLEDWLREPDAISFVSRSNAGYFDRYVEPERVGEQILHAVSSLAVDA